MSEHDKDGTDLEVAIETLDLHLRPGDGWSKTTFPKSMLPMSIEVMPKPIHTDGVHRAEKQKLWLYSRRELEKVEGDKKEYMVKDAIRRMVFLGYTHLYEFHLKHHFFHVFGEEPFDNVVVISHGMIIRDPKTETWNETDVRTEASATFEKRSVPSTDSDNVVELAAQMRSSEDQEDEMAQDFENVSLEDLKVLARDLWWMLDAIALSNIAHRGMDAGFRASVTEILKMREDMGVASNDGRVLLYDPDRHDREEVGKSFFMVRPDGELYPDDVQIKRSKILKEIKEDGRKVTNCDCDSCKACTTAMWRAHDALVVSSNELEKIEARQSDVLGSVMRQMAIVLRMLAEGNTMALVKASSELTGSATYLHNMVNVWKMDELEFMLLGRAAGKLRNVFAQALTPEQVAKFPEEIKSKLREIFEAHGVKAPPEIASDEDKKNFH